MPTAPPLGGGLYGRLVGAYPETWGKLPLELDAVFRSPAGFEAGTERLWNRPWHEGDPVPANLLIQMAWYFADFTLTRAAPNAYSLLIEVLERNGLLGTTVLASLNYECLLEMAIERAGLKVVYLADATRHETVLVLKPHGSCNFLPQLEARSLSIVVSGEAGIYEGPLDFVSTQEVQRRYSELEWAIPPAMSLYAPNKPSRVGRATIGGIRDQWEKVVEAARVIVVIGTRPVLADRHVWDPIVSSRAEVWYLASTSDPGYLDLQERLGRRLVPLGTRFSKDFGALEAKLAGRARSWGTVTGGGY